MTRTLTISLLIFFLADAVGCILFLFVDWFEIRKEMTHFIDSREFENKAAWLTFDKEEFAKIQWIEKDHEFFHEGKLYDMVSMQKQKEQIRIQCVADEREASLFKTMQKLVV